MTIPRPDAGAYWPIPEPHDAATVHLADGGIIILRRHGNPDGPRLVLSHGSSFSADAYFPFWSRLLPRFDLIVYDLRNHGRNPLGDLAGHHMPMKTCSQSLPRYVIENQDLSDSGAGSTDRAGTIRQGLRAARAPLCG